MHVGGIELDPQRFLQLFLSFACCVVVLLYAVKNTASKYFEVDANFESSRINHTPMDSDDSPVCANCGIFGNKKCSRCKSVRYCSSSCQEVHWKSEHKIQCPELCKLKAAQGAKSSFGLRGSRNSSGIALVPTRGITKPIKTPRKILFPYDEFVKLYNWDNPGFPPCGLLNCGNSCFANVVLQCLTYTRPLVAYLMEKGHQRECRRNDWCFLCELGRHVVRCGQNSQPFSPINILSRLPNIGGNLGYGRQEDAHEFMRFAIDTMQLACLDEFGGEKVVEPSSQETTLVQHIFGGRLQSQVLCTNCKKISNQFENMMDLTVEIHGDAASLEECLDQFTKKEWLDGDNMYKCDGCNDYVKAWKRLTIQRAPNVLTIALKRFQSGRFGKLNKRVSFPETLDLTPYMSEEGDGADVYKLYAVVVHVDMLNASFFGHYICYTKDFAGNWYRIDDCKVSSVDLDEVLSQGAYMLLYSRVSVQPSSLRVEPKSEQHPVAKTEVDAYLKENGIAVSCASDNSSEVDGSHVEDDMGFANGDSRSAVPIDVSPGGTEPSSCADPKAAGNSDHKDVSNSELHSSALEISSSYKDAPTAGVSGSDNKDVSNSELHSSAVESNKDAPTAHGSGSVVDKLRGINAAVDTEDGLAAPMDISDCESEGDPAIDSSVGNKVVTADSVNACLPNCDFDSANVNTLKINGSVY